MSPKGVLLEVITRIWKGAGQVPPAGILFGPGPSNHWHDLDAATQRQNNKV